MNIQAHTNVKLTHAHTNVHLYMKLRKRNAVIALRAASGNVETIISGSETLGYGE